MKDLELLKISKTFYKHTDVRVCTKLLLLLFFKWLFFIGSFLKLSLPFDKGRLEYKTARKDFFERCEREIERNSSTSLDYVVHSFHRWSS